MRADQPSSTATLIAASTVFLARDARIADLVPNGSADWCIRYLQSVSPRILAAVHAVSHPLLRWIPRLAERATVNGLLLHFMLRKRWIEEIVRTDLQEGTQQVMIIGAGFDTLASRLHIQFPLVHFIEIDHPATQRPKRLALGTVPSSHNFHLIPADLSQVSLQDTLTKCAAFRSNTPTTIIIEGLMMYLSDDEIAKMFTTFTEIFHAPLRIVFTMMEPTKEGRSAFHNATWLVTNLLSLWNEPFKSSLERTNVESFLKPFQLRLCEIATTETLRERYLVPFGQENLPLARGEMIVVAEKKGGRP